MFLQERRRKDLDQCIRENNDQHTNDGILNQRRIGLLTKCRSGILIPRVDDHHCTDHKCHLRKKSYQVDHIVQQRISRERSAGKLRTDIALVLIVGGLLIERIPDTSSGLAHITHIFRYIDRRLRDDLKIIINRECHERRKTHSQYSHSQQKLFHIFSTKNKYYRYIYRDRISLSNTLITPRTYS